MGLVVRPLLDRMTQGAETDVPATTVPVTTPSTTVASSDDPTDSGGEPTGDAVARAIAVIAEKGYTADPGDGRIGGTLSVFIGIASDSATAYNQKAFFFVGPELRYIGTDTTNPSRGIRVSWTTGMTVALEYQLYRADDANCCPSGGTAEVRYQWDGLQLTPLDEIPADYGTDTFSR
jgi:LppP/LprE lipoprotein